MAVFNCCCEIWHAKTFWSEGKFSGFWHSLRKGQQPKTTSDRDQQTFVPQKMGAENVIWSRILLKFRTTTTTNKFCLVLPCCKIWTFVHGNNSRQFSLELIRIINPMLVTMFFNEALGAWASARYTMVTKSYVHFPIFLKNRIRSKIYSKRNTQLLIANYSALARFHFLQATLNGIIKVSDCFGINYFPKFDNFFAKFSHVSTCFCNLFLIMVHIFSMGFLFELNRGHSKYSTAWLQKKVWWWQLRGLVHCCNKQLRCEHSSKSILLPPPLNPDWPCARSAILPWGTTQCPRVASLVLLTWNEIQDITRNSVVNDECIHIM